MTLTRESLANYAHLVWAGWMNYMFACSRENEDGSVTIPAELVARWKRQAATLYPDLPPDEQESDLRQADRIMSVIEKCGGVKL